MVWLRGVIYGINNILLAWTPLFSWPEIYIFAWPELHYFSDLNSIIFLTWNPLFSRPELHYFPNLKSIYLFDLNSLFSWPEIQYIPDLKYIIFLTCTTLFSWPELHYFPDLNSIFFFLNSIIFLTWSPILSDPNSITLLSWPVLNYFRSINSITLLTSTPLFARASWAYKKRKKILTCFFSGGQISLTNFLLNKGYKRINNESFSWQNLCGLVESKVLYFLCCTSVQ